jgi:protein-tyrosine phosphatase
MLLTRVQNVLFICTANYYRSRFSEYWFNALAEENGLGWQATSRGLKTWMVDGQGPISRFTVEHLGAKGIHLGRDIRFPLQLTEADLECADLVVAVKEAEHRPMMMEQFPFWADRINYWNVHDLDCQGPEEALPVCEACIETLVQGLLAEQRATGRNRRRLAA